MLNRLKKTLFPVQAQTVFKVAKVNTEHTEIDFVQLNVLSKKFLSKKDAHDIVQHLQMFMVSNNKVLRLKAFISCHYLLRKTAHEELLFMLSQQTLKHNTKVKFTNFTKTEDITDFYEIYVIEPYQYYLNKLSSNFQVYQYSKNICSTTKDTFQLVSRGFQVLNLIHIILKTQETMNKLGRYYTKNREILTLFTVYLQDLSIFNAFLKQASKIIIQSSLKCQDPQIIKHFYLFLIQSQKISDRLYQYYHNRYFYRDLKNNEFVFPTFLQIKKEEFKEIKKRVKILDKVFYEEISQRERGKLNATQSRIKLDMKPTLKSTLSLIETKQDKYNSSSNQMFQFNSVYSILQ